ncbi:hypothetical protein [Larkinella knui]|uniref:Uncharacterized protein n=1 Tax=Larkinella knui TaxID=2025310 RepID=A0A3P1CV01_9BACT|nr:hypothetical protein [Larkinella knui]RRB17135.1 hypothetical protein EHT87_02315 [Larkinella knui]
MPSHQAIQTTVIQDTHQTNPSTDSAVYLVQDEDEQPSPTIDQDFLPSLPVAWLSLLMAVLMLQPILRIAIAKRAVPSRPYYLLFCALRIPSV